MKRLKKVRVMIDMRFDKLYKITDGGKEITGTIGQLSKALYMSRTTILNRYYKPDHYNDFKVEIVGEIDHGLVSNIPKKIYHVIPIGRTKACFSGTSDEVVEKFGVTRGHLYKCANQGVKLKGDYIVKKEEKDK